MNLFKKTSAFILFFLFLTSSHAFARPIENWTINTFNSEIYLNQDSSADITETITADFSREAHHGIERDIPFDYENGRLTRVTLSTAIDENGNSWKVNQFEEDGYLKVQMTTPDNHLINTQATFILTYHIDNIINFFDDHDEFYWNINGVDWDVPTKEASATIHSPTKLSDPIKVVCYTGEYGAKGTDCNYEKIDSKSIKIKNTKPLGAYEGVNAVLSLPQNYFSEESFQKNSATISNSTQTNSDNSSIDISNINGNSIKEFLLNNKLIFLPFLVFLIMYGIWYHHGRDDQSVSDTIVPTFIPPKNLSPTETGTIIDEKLDPRDIIACIIEHAVKGFIKIIETEKQGLFSKKTDYELEIIKICPLEKKFEEKIILGIFDANKVGQKKKISDLENHFYVHVSGIEDAVMKKLVDEDYFPVNPETTRNTYNVIGFGTAFVAFFILNLNSPVFMFAIAASGLLIAGFGAIMPRKTKKGTETYYQLKGLYEYINTAEKDRMKFQEKNNILFEKLLPYAMAFGIIDKWTKAFDGILKEPPTWYYPIGSRNFNMIYLSNSLSNFSSSTMNNLSSRPGGRGGHGAWSGGSGFGGGGFSGGGFGGGGGHGL